MNQHPTNKNTPKLLRSIASITLAMSLVAACHSTRYTFSKEVPDNVTFHDSMCPFRYEAITLSTVHTRKTRTYRERCVRIISAQCLSTLSRWSLSPPLSHHHLALAPHSTTRPSPSSSRHTLFFAFYHFTTYDPAHIKDESQLPRERANVHAAPCYKASGSIRRARVGGAEKENQQRSLKKKASPLRSNPQCAARHKKSRSVKCKKLFRNPNQSAMDSSTHLQRESCLYRPQVDQVATLALYCCCSVSQAEVLGFHLRLAASALPFRCQSFTPPVLLLNFHVSGCGRRCLHSWVCPRW